MNRFAITLAVLPLLPFLVLGAGMLVDSRASWELSAIYVLGLAGAAGLVAAGMRRTYRSVRVRAFASVLLVCGYCSVAGLYALLLSSFSGGGGGPNVAVGFTVLSLVLAWPAAAGFFALHRLWHGR